MQALPIVIALDPIDDIQAGLGTRFVVVLIDSLDLQCLEEALHRRVVPGVGTTAHRHAYLERGGQFPVRATGILGAAIGVQQQSRWRLALPASAAQRLADQIRVNPTTGCSRSRRPRPASPTSCRSIRRCIATCSARPGCPTRWGPGCSGSPRWPACPTAIPRSPSSSRSGASTMTSPRRR